MLEKQVSLPKRDATENCNFQRVVVCVEIIGLDTFDRGLLFIFNYLAAFFAPIFIKFQFQSDKLDFKIELSKQMKRAATVDNKCSMKFDMFMTGLH